MVQSVIVEKAMLGDRAVLVTATLVLLTTLSIAAAAAVKVTMVNATQEHSFGFSSHGHMRY